MYHINTPIPYSDSKLGITSFIRKKWQREWDGYTKNKLKEIKPNIAIWPTCAPPCKIDIIITCLKIRHSSLTHRHLLLAKEEPTCPHYRSSVLTICHLLTDCYGLRYMYRCYFHSSSPSLMMNLLNENYHHELINFFKRFRFLSWHFFFSLIVYTVNFNVLIVFC